MQDNLAKMRRARAFLNLALTSAVATLLVHVLEIDLGAPAIHVWGLGAGATVLFGLLFLASAPISGESKLRFWTVFARTHVADFIEMAALRSMLMGSFRTVAWILVVGGVGVAFVPRYEGGLEELNAYLDRRFTPPETLESRAKIQRTVERFEAEPHSIDACRELAYLLTRTGRSQEAYDVLSRGLAAHPGDDEEQRDPPRIDLLTLKAVVCKELGRDQEEVELWREILAGRQEDVEARHDLGMALLRLRNFTEAEIELRKAVDLAVDDLKNFKKRYQVTAESVKTLAESLTAQLEGLKFRAGASAYQLAIVSSLLNKTRDAPRHLRFARQLGYEVNGFDRDLQRYQPQASPAPPPQKPQR